MNVSMTIKEEPDLQVYSGSAMVVDMTSWPISPCVLSILHVTLFWKRIVSAEQDISIGICVGLQKWQSN